MKLAILLLLISFNSCLAAESTKLFSIVDSYTENVKISGGFFVGAMFKSGKSANNLNQIYIYTPEDYNKDKYDICVEVNSIDGKYEGLFEGKKKFDPKYNVVTIDSAHIDKIKSYELDKIVILASIKENCRENNKIGKYIPSSWSMTERKDGELDIFINSNVTDTKLSVTYYDSDNKHEIKCSRFKFERAVAYNTICTVGVGEKVIKKLTIIREEPGENYQPKVFNIALK